MNLKKLLKKLQNNYLRSLQLRFLFTEPPKALMEVMEIHRNSTEFLISPMGLRDQKTPPEDINPQLCKVMNYFTNDQTGLQNLEKSPAEAYYKCERIDLNSLIGSVLNFC